jgi:anti-sigma regulatory factor (Ser/Thr protein kinase)
MITKREVLKHGYSVLPKGGWIRIESSLVPHDWEDLAKNFGFDPDCDHVILCVAGVKQNEKK